MKIRVGDIPNSGLHIDQTWGQEELTHFLPEKDFKEIRLKPGAKIHLDIKRFPDHIHIGGSIYGGVNLSCDRCLEMVEYPLDEAVSIFLVDVLQAPEEEEIELSKENLKYEFFDGQIIEVDRLIAEQIFLAVPVKVLCSASCKGLCPVCGANLNKVQCGCGLESRESPFAGLEAIKPNLPKGN